MTGSAKNTPSSPSEALTSDRDVVDPRGASPASPTRGRGADPGLTPWVGGRPAPATPSGRPESVASEPLAPEGDPAPTAKPAVEAPAGPWAARWGRLAHGLGLAPTTPVAVALSGGADSVYLLHLLARSEARPKVLAIHVDHRMRGEESQEDAAFCARLCAKLGIPFARKVAEIDPRGGDVEARAREARYRALSEEASAAGISVLLTGHHENDAVETLLMRWMRGTDLGGLAGLRREAVLGKGKAATGDTAGGTRVLRPLLGMRREEVRSALRREQLEWREDRSNGSSEFSRNRVRNEVLPQIEESCGEEGVENFFEFARAIESFEDELADRTGHIQWESVAHESARRSESMPALGGTLPRAALAELNAPLLRRALGRLIGEGTGRRPSRALLAEVGDAIEEGRTCRLEVHGGWTLQLRADALHLTPPTDLLRPEGDTAPGSAGPISGPGLVLGVPGAVQLGDGRSVSAEVAAGPQGADGDATVVEIDGVGVQELRVRFARPGDRFHALGAPGHKPVRRFLGEAGVPREERGLVPIVLAGEEVVWVAGVAVSERHKVTDPSRRRIRLSLVGAKGGSVR